MSHFHLAVEIAFAISEDDTDERFEAFLDDIHASFEKIGRPVSLSARFTSREADFAAVITAPDFEAAVNTFLVDVRTALHAAGCGTPRWPGFAPIRRTVRELQDAVDLAPVGDSA